MLSRMRTESIASNGPWIGRLTLILRTLSQLQQRFREPSLTVLLVLQVLEIFVSGPLSAMHLLPIGITVLLDAAIVIVVFFVASGNRTAQAVIIASAFVDGVAWLLTHVEPNAVTIAIDFAARVIFLLALTAVLLHVVFGDQEEGTYHRIQGGIAVYFNVAVMFGLLYRLADFLDPQSFATHVRGGGTDLDRFIYFSFETLTTTGYGDIAPIDPLVRSAANLESVIGQLFTATLLARLVSRYFFPR
jgi:hypothetical protein